MLTNLPQALAELDASDVPVAPAPPPDNTWDPPTAAISKVMNWFKQGVELGWNRASIFHWIIDKARTDYNRTVTRRQLREIWDAWKTRIAEIESA